MSASYQITFISILSLRIKSESSLNFRFLVLFIYSVIYLLEEPLSSSGGGGEGGDNGDDGGGGLSSGAIAGTVKSYY